MQNVVLVIHLLLALGIIGIVLLQRSEGGGLGMGGGGGGGVMSSRGTATALSKVTWALGIAFIATSLTLTILAARDAATSSVMDAAGRHGTGCAPMATRRRRHCLSTCRRPPGMRRSRHRRPTRPGAGHSQPGGASQRGLSLLERSAWQILLDGFVPDRLDTRPPRPPAGLV
jgi:preprotein translocase subunit SecG